MERRAPSESGVRGAARLEISTSLKVTCVRCTCSVCFTSSAIDLPISDQGTNVSRPLVNTRCCRYPSFDTSGSDTGPYSSLSGGTQLSSACNVYITRCKHWCSVVYLLRQLLKFATSKTYILYLFSRHFGTRLPRQQGTICFHSSTEGQGSQQLFNT